MPKTDKKTVLLIISITVILPFIIFLSFINMNTSNDEVILPSITTTAVTIITEPPIQPTVTTKNDPQSMTTTTTLPPKVEFRLFMDTPSYELCCGLIPDKIKILGRPILKNKGNIQAHNVRASFKLFDHVGEIVLINEEKSLERIVGDMPPGKEISEPVEFTIGLVDGYKIQDSGAVAFFEIYSDEKNATFKEEFKVPET